LKFSIQSSSAKFPYRIRMVCGHVEIRMLNLKTIGRYFDDDLVINAASGAGQHAESDRNISGAERTLDNAREGAGGVK
jgi:hypothetical protein